MGSSETATLIAAVAAVAAVGVSLYGFRRSVLEERRRWTRDHRLLLYVDMLAEAVAGAEWMGKWLKATSPSDYPPVSDSWLHSRGLVQARSRALAVPPVKQAFEAHYAEVTKATLETPGQLTHVQKYRAMENARAARERLETVVAEALDRDFR